MSSKLELVIVGGGTGAQLARDLSGKLDASKVSITLVDARPYRVHLIAMARIIVTDEGNLEKDAFAPYDKLFINGNGQFIQGRAISVETEKGGKSGDVVLEGGKRVHFDVLVLAPGSKWSGAIQVPDDAAEATKVLAQARESFKTAKKVVIAGAGAVGLGASNLLTFQKLHAGLQYLCSSRNCGRNQRHLPCACLLYFASTAFIAFISHSIS